MDPDYGVQHWFDAEPVDNACENENCAEYRIPKRYPSRMEYSKDNVVDCYFDLPMRCSTCGSLYPPANEGQLEEQTDPVVQRVRDMAAQRMRTASGEVDSNDKLVMFLYLLARDWVPTGTIDGLVDYKLPVEGTFTNGWLARWAHDVAMRLTAADEKGKQDAT